MPVEDTRHFQESDWDHLRRLRDLVAGHADSATVAAALDDIGRSARNGLVVAIEVDVRALHGLGTSARHRYVPKDEHAALDPEALRALVLARIDAIGPGVCDVPESVFRIDIHTIEHDGELIAVREIARKDWDYLLYVTTSGAPAHYVEIDHGSHAVYTVVKRLTTEDSQRLSAGEVTGADLDRLVDRYR